MLVVVGHVDSGKTTFANIAESLNYHVFEMGDEIRKLYRAANTTKPYTEFVSEKFDLEGKSSVAKIVVDKIKKCNIDPAKTVIVGPRTLEEVAYIQDSLGPTIIVLIWANMQERYKRWNANRDLISRAMSYEEFIDRNQIEDDWGLAQVLAKKDKTLVNEESIDKFEAQAGAYLESIKDQEHLLFARFKPTEKLGEGFSKVTWKALDRTMGDRVVALKILKAKGRFKDLLREAKIGGALEHENIALMYEVNEKEGYLVEQFVEGESLEEVIRKRALHKSVSISESVNILTQLLNALCYAHNERQRIHGDLKPANIMICRGDGLKVKLTDFEVGRIIAEAGETISPSDEALNLGSQRYWAPELFEGKPRSKKSDLFGLGIVAYLLFTQRSPFLHPCGFIRETNLIKCKSYRPDKLSKHNPRLPEELDDVVLRLLEEENKRYDDAEEVRDEFLAIDFG